MELRPGARIELLLFIFVRAAQGYARVRGLRFSSRKAQLNEFVLFRVIS